MCDGGEDVTRGLERDHDRQLTWACRAVRQERTGTAPLIDSVQIIWPGVPVLALSPYGERVCHCQNLETRVSLAVINSSNAGLPALVCSMPRWIAAWI